MKYSALILALVAATATAASARTMVLDDMKSLSGLSEPAISPDGSVIAFILSVPDYKTDRSIRTLMLYNLSDSGTRPLTAGRRGVASPAWSPDGKRLAFLSITGEGDKAKEQVFVLDMRGGDAAQLTHAANGVEQFTWRPDGGAIAYVTPDDPVNKKDVEHHLDAFVVGDQAYQEKAAPTPNHIWLINADGSGDKRLTQGTWSLPTATPPGPPASPLSWSPDGKSIIFTRMPNAYDTDGYLATVDVLDVQSGTIRTLTSHGKYEGYGSLSPDGSKVAYFYPFQGDPSAQNDILVTSPAGGNGNDVTADGIDTNVARAIWMPDSKSLLIAGHKGTDAALWIKPIDGTAQRLQLGEVQPVQPFWLDASVSNTGAIAFTGSESNHPTELYYMSSSTATPKRLTSYNDAVAKLDLGKVQPVTWSFEGFSENGTLTYPPGYDPSRAYPLVLVVHGGPNSASILSFSTLNQLLAARGFLVFNPNYRGSDNQGESYWHAIFNDAGAGPGRDVMAGIAAVEQAAHVDTSRIGVSGWSYGGYMTSWLEGHYNIWKAAVAGAAVNNWVDEYALSDNNVTVGIAELPGSPFVGNNIALYRAQSPITYAWNITAPTLILSDTGDVRVPITQSYEMFRALTDHGVTTRFFAYPIAGHSPGDPVRAMDVNRRWIDWLVQYLKP
ncbi:MAG TPA: S9 family peptidase [Candidatus Rubrimentiphilum sp.]|nr:S9 family peptidase [Candidatus Rubrimentiphilum sp.]